MIDKVFKGLAVVWVVYLSFVAGFMYANVVNNNVVEVVGASGGVVSVSELCKAESTGGLEIANTEALCGSYSGLEVGDNNQSWHGVTEDFELVSSVDPQQAGLNE